MSTLRMFICRAFGHSRRYTTVQRMRLTRGGYFAMRPTTRVHCVRCGMGGDGCYEWSWLERARDRWRAWMDSIERCKHTPPPTPQDDGLPF